MSVFGSSDCRRQRSEQVERKPKRVPCEEHVCICGTKQEGESLGRRRLIWRSLSNDEAKNRNDPKRGSFNSDETLTKKQCVRDEDTVIDSQ